MLWEVEIRPVAGQPDHEGNRVLASARSQGIAGLTEVLSARSFLIEGDISEADVHRVAADMLCDPVVECFQMHRLPDDSDGTAHSMQRRQISVLLHPGVTDSVADNALKLMKSQNLTATAVATCRKYWVSGSLSGADLKRLTCRILSNEAIEYSVEGPLTLTTLSVGSEYRFRAESVSIGKMSDEQLVRISTERQLHLNLVEMKTVRDYFQSLQRDPTEIELETIAQTWSEHCSHKTLGGRIRYSEIVAGQVSSERSFRSMLKETIFEATQQIRQRLGDDDWCVSVFRDNAGIVRFDEKQNVCIKVETHNHPSAIEPYGGANTGLGGVIRDPLGTGLGARPVCSTDVFCFAPPDFPADRLPPGVLHPRSVMQGVVAGVRDYGNRMGIPTVNGAVCFDERYLGNPLVYCGNVAMMPIDKCEKRMSPGDFIVAVGGRTGRDGIHGATFSSVELTEESETVSGGAVQIGNPVTEKMLADVILAARDRNLYTSITDCGAGGFSSAVGEMGEETGAEVWLDRAPLKYPGLSFTEIWISEAQERMVLAVPEACWEEFRSLCASEGVEATIIGRFTDTHELVLKYQEHEVGRLSMSFLHDGRPPVVREAVYQITPSVPTKLPQRSDYTDSLHRILSSLNVASKEWIIRQYDHEVQAGSVIKPLVGIANDGPSDAAVVRPDLKSSRGLVVSSAINPGYGDSDPYWMAASAIDEAVRNCVSVGADPSRIAILDNFCWGNTERPETLGSLVRAAVGCHDIAVAYGTPFVSGKDSLNNEFSYEDAAGVRRTVAIPSTLLITALGQVEDVEHCVTMDLKKAGNALYLVGLTNNDCGFSQFASVEKIPGGEAPRVDPVLAPSIFRGVHSAIRQGLVRSCHDLSEGGLAVSVAEMAFAGGIGATIRLSDLPVSSPDLSDAARLFSESNSRFLLEVPVKTAELFEKTLQGVPFARIGETVSKPELTVYGTGGSVVVNADLSALKESWQKPLRTV
ncbi:MAG: phosphoribosylformylglycinamidine synthase subunit PurL [Planctomyces sp.]